LDPAALRAELERLKAPRRTVRITDVQPQLAEMYPQPFSAKGWVFEIKYDGFRTFAAKEGARGRLRSRHGKDPTAQYPELVEALEALPVEQVVLDGELVVHDDEGRPSFERLQRRALLRRPTEVARASRESPAFLYLFDLLALEGFDVRPLPLLQRKALLRRVLPRGGRLIYVDHIEEKGAEMYGEVQRMALEGVVAKKADSAYLGGRTPRWRKLRVNQTADLVIVGFVPWGASKVAELDLAAYEQDGELVYAGSVAHILGDALRRELRKVLETIRRPKPPCARAPTGEHHAWVDPELVCEARYLTWVPGGQLRHASFLRMRDDKRPEECLRPDPVPLEAGEPPP
jgi:bifunctional non-homologous end joining protein LigD